MRGVKAVATAITTALLARCRRARAEGEGTEGEGPELESKSECAPLEGHIMAESGHTCHQRSPSTHASAHRVRRPQADEDVVVVHLLPLKNGPDRTR